MREFGAAWLKTTVAIRMRSTAMQRGVFRGGSHPSDMAYLEACTATHLSSGTVLIFTRDEGYHSSGWWKNPDYERCFHLSMGFVDVITGELAPKDKSLTVQWIDAFFHKNSRMIWCESPYSRDGISHDVWHYRLFMAPDWVTPILPRGEVYSKAFTEKGWKSFSELHDAEVGPASRTGRVSALRSGGEGCARKTRTAPPRTGHDW